MNEVVFCCRSVGESSERGAAPRGGRGLNKYSLLFAASRDGGGMLLTWRCGATFYSLQFLWYEDAECILLGIELQRGLAKRSFRVGWLSAVSK